MPSTQAAESADSTGTRPQENGETPTPSVRVGGFGGESVTPLSSLSISVEPTNQEPAARERENAKKIASAQEEKGGVDLSDGYKPLGAKVPVKLYDDVEKAANLLDIGKSDVVRNGVMLYLQVLGFDQRLTIDGDAVAAAARKLKEYEERAANLLPVVAAPPQALKELRKAAKGIQTATYRTDTARELAGIRDGAKSLDVAMRMWRNPENRRIIQRAAELEPKLPVNDRLHAGPPILHPLRNHLGSYAALRDALVAETGVPA